jgi:general secretion pathway protein L
MAQKIVGLDIGNYSMKAVVLESTFRGWELVGYHESRLGSEYVEAERMIEQTEAPPENGALDTNTTTEQAPPEDSAEDAEDQDTYTLGGNGSFDPKKERLRIAMSQFIRSHGADWDSIYTAFHGDAISMKSVKLPFTELKKIDETLPYTLEDMVPFNLKDKVVDYQMLSREPGNTTLLVGIIDRNHMAEYLANFDNIGKEPKAVVVDSLALGNLFEQLGEPTQKEGVTAVLDFGHRTTSICLIDGGNIAYARTIPRGSQDLTRALAQEFDLDFEDAERKKHSNGFLPSLNMKPNSPGEASIAETLSKAIEPLMRQVGLTFQSYVGASKRHITRILIVGGGSRLTNLPDFLSERFKVQAEPFSYLNGSFNRLADSDEVEPTMAMGLGLAFTGLSGSRLKKLNFRKGPFAFKGNYDYWKTRIAHLALSVALVFMFFIISIWAQFYVLGKQGESMKGAIASTCKEILGKDITDAKICMAQMMEVIGNQNTGGTKLKSEVSIITLFDELSSRMTGEGMSVEVEELEIKTDKLKIKGEVDSIATVGTIVNNLRGYPCFADINQGPTRANVRGDRIEFSLSILVDCTKLNQAKAAGTAVDAAPDTETDGDADNEDEPAPPRPMKGSPAANPAPDPGTETNQETP